MRTRCCARSRSGPWAASAWTRFWTTCRCRSARVSRCVQEWTRPGDAGGVRGVLTGCLRSTAHTGRRPVRAQDGGAGRRQVLRPQPDRVRAERLPGGLGGHAVRLEPDGALTFLRAIALVEARQGPHRCVRPVMTTHAGRRERRGRARRHLRRVWQGHYCPEPAAPQQAAGRPQRVQRVRARIWRPCVSYGATCADARARGSPADGGERTGGAKSSSWTRWPSTRPPAPARPSRSASASARASRTPTPRWSCRPSRSERWTLCCTLCTQPVLTQMPLGASGTHARTPLH